MSLEPVFGSIDAYATTIETAVARLEAATGLPPVVVAHSMGGLAMRHWWAEQARLRPQSAATRLHRLITLGTPHQGTWLAKLAFTTNARQMRIGSPWLARLAQQEPADHRARTTCYFSDCDNIVFPAEQATLHDALNIRLAGAAHVAMVDRPEPYAEVLRGLEAIDAH